MKVNTDVLIVGSGLAGLYTALNLNDNLKVTIITKSSVDNCNTYLAQGGISTVLNKEDEAVFVEDTLKAGLYKNDIDMVKILAEDAKKNIDYLEELGVNFDKRECNYHFTREGAHSVNRIVHYKDFTGKHVFECVLDAVKKKNNIKIIENCCLVDLLVSGNMAKGAVCILDGKTVLISAKITVLATGGIGGLFKNSTNDRVIKAEGIAIALRNNILVKNLNYVQFHPTALYEEGVDNKRFLISESLRGEGALLLNNKGERFVDELLPRDVVSKKILEEEEKTKCKCVYLDITFLPSDVIIERFPTIYEECLKRNIDITKDRIPVTPAQHFLMGGIQVDKHSKTSMENLYACGEVSCTGVHGANRLASNSLLEALVFSNRAAENINKVIPEIKLENCKEKIKNKIVLEHQLENKRVIIHELIKVREDIKNELVSC
ncbi:L-aspartate oxidase [Clostridium grantii]|uniref:L-aspartate oxidase n=1 Tax=Clostridium grantii DSM 8605 TaxID=1121316 RepID=A0A1M5R0I3_9CLOT|nr:L-aspartate oxidase [Clostridium grantii]SHH19668.1 L-aspartate oxidase [Clostridium grantii DSM 8605]